MHLVTDRINVSVRYSSITSSITYPTFCYLCLYWKYISLDCKDVAVDPVQCNLLLLNPAHNISPIYYNLHLDVQITYVNMNRSLTKAEYTKHTYTSSSVSPWQDNFRKPVQYTLWASSQHGSISFHARCHCLSHFYVKLNDCDIVAVQQFEMIKLLNATSNAFHKWCFPKCPCQLLKQEKVFIEMFKPTVPQNVSDTGIRSLTAALKILFHALKTHRTCLLCSPHCDLIQTKNAHKARAWPQLWLGRDAGWPLNHIHFKSPATTITVTVVRRRQEARHFWQEVSIWCVGRE